MSENNKAGFAFFKNYVDKQYQGLTQGMKGLMQSNSKGPQLQSTFMDNKFICPIHPYNTIKYFTENPSNGKPYILCTACLSDGMNSEKTSDPNESPRRDPSVHKIKDLFPFFTEVFGQMKYSFESKNIQKTILNDFIARIPEMQAQMTQSIEDEKRRFAVETSRAIEIFTTTVNAIRDKVFNLLSSELQTFDENIKHLKNNIDLFYGTLKTFDDIPKSEDLKIKLNKIRTTEELIGYIKEYTIVANILAFQLDVFNNKHYEYYKNSLSLLRKIHQNLLKPPKNPVYDHFTFKPEIQTTCDFIKQVGETIVNQELPTKLQLIRRIESFNKSTPLNKDAENIEQLEQPLIDALDSYYPSTPKGLQCLHYYDPDKNCLTLVKLDELNGPYSAEDSKSAVVRIRVPIDVKISRLAKSISLPDGTIYFIGGEEVSSTVMFECKELEVKKSQKPVSLAELKDDMSSSTIGLIDPGKRKSPAKGDAPHYTTQINFINKARMNTQRYGHGLVFMGNDSIYSISGCEVSSESEYSDKCERFIIKEDRWVDIQDCYYPVNHPGVCGFGTSYIYKYGGYIDDEGTFSNKIERYHIDKNTWAEINLASLSGEIRSGAKNSLVQINDQQIMILGGCTKEFLFSEDCSLLSLCTDDSENGQVVNPENSSRGSSSQGSNNITSLINRRDFDLPLDNRLVHQILIYGGKVYCLTIRPSFEETVKNVVVFDGQNWTII